MRSSGKTLDSRRAALEPFLRELTGPVLVFVEACRTWEWVSDLCEDLGHEFRLVNPREMPEIAKSAKKTDRNDVEAMVRRFLIEGDLPRSYRATRVERERRSLSRRLSDLRDQRRKALLKIHAVIDAHGMPAKKQDFTKPEWRDGIRSTAMIVLVAIAAISPMAGQAAAQSQEAIFAFEASGSSCLGPAPCIVVIDPLSGQPIFSTKIAAPPVPLALVHDGQRLLSVNVRPGKPGPELFQYYPATGQVRAIGLLGVSWDSWDVAYNPQDGFLYSIANPKSQQTNNLYRIDPQTGVATLLFPLTGATTFAQGFAIDSMGFGYIGCRADALCTIDLASGSTTFLGSLALNGILLDLAFDSSDKLWAGVLGGLSSQSGLYKIDLGTLGVTKLTAAGPFKYSGITFGPSCISASYCTAKVNSLGCLPTIEGVGYPAPSAAFGFKVVAKNVRSNRFGILIVSTGGRSAIPFQGGTLCVALPVSRAVIANSGGSHPPTQDCSGVWVADFNAYLFGPNPPRTLLRDNKFPPVGTQYNVQWWGRDVFGSPALTQGLEFSLCP